LKSSTPAAQLYVAVLAVVAVGVSAWLAADGARAALGSGLALIMLGIAVADARNLVIPDVLTAAALLLGALNAGLGEEGMSLPAAAEAALRGCVLALSFAALRAVYYWLRRRHGIGIGDIKLAAVAGVWLAWTSVAIAVEIAALAAVAYYTFLQWRRGRPVRGQAVLPFGLFLAPTIWLVWLVQVTIFEPPAFAGWADAGPAWVTVDDNLQRWLGEDVQNGRWCCTMWRARWYWRRSGVT
jgi:leader peptidase (prepilin peptidase)/N-methyltransferase